MFFFLFSFFLGGNILAITYKTIGLEMFLYCCISYYVFFTRFQPIMYLCTVSLVFLLYPNERKTPEKIHITIATKDEPKREIFMSTRYVFLLLDFLRQSILILPLLRKAGKNVFTVSFWQFRLD